MNTIFIFGVLLVFSPLCSQFSDADALTRSPSYRKELDEIKTEIADLPYEQQNTALAHMLALERMEKKTKEQTIYQLNEIDKRKIDQHDEKNWRIIYQLERERDNFLPYKAIFVIRSMIDYREKDLYPRDFEETNNRYERWMIILHFGDAHVESILKHIRSIYSDLNEEDAMTEFALAVQTLYGDSCPKPPRTFDQRILDRIKEDEEQMQITLGLMGISYDDYNENLVKAVQVLAEPFGLPKSRTDRTEKEPVRRGPTSLNCLEIIPYGGKFQRNPTDNDDEVYDFFYNRVPEQVVYKPSVVPLTKGKFSTNKHAEKFIVRFVTFHDTVEALTMHADLLKGRRVKVYFNNCSELPTNTTTDGLNHA